MYGQFQNPASAAKWIFFGFIGVVLMAILLGTDFKSATWLNSQIADAQARDLNVETAYKEQQHQLALEQEQIRLQAERERLAQELATQKTLDNFEIARRQRSSETWMTVLTFIGGAISIAIILISVVWTVSKVSFKANPKQTITETTAKPANNKNEETKKYWQERREWARDNEEWFRSVAIMEARLKTATNSKSTDKDKRDNLPLAI